MPPIIDRLLLGNTGMEFDEKTYIQVVAGLGVLWVSKAGEPPNALGWSPHNFRVGFPEIGEHQRAQSLLKYRTKWINHLTSSNKRVLLKEHEFDLKAPDLLAIAQILNHSAANAESVIIEKETPLADLRWQWPMRIATLPTDSETINLTALRRAWPAKSLVEIHSLTRENARCEALIIPGPVREALRRIIELPHSVRASHILLFGPVDIKWRDLQSYVNALFAETQAGALSLISLPSSGILPEVLNHWVEHLSHDEPYDLALTRAFPRDSSFHMIDPRMPARTALRNVARDLGRRLKRLPPRAGFKLRKSTPSRINSTWTPASGPSVLGMELEERAGALPFDHESDGGTGLSEIAAAERGARRKAAIKEPARFLQGELFSYSLDGPTRENRGLVRGKQYRLDVFIGPPGEAQIKADQPFPDDTLDWRGIDSFTLQVLFAEPRQWGEPLTATLILPRYGASRNCQFIFSPTVEGPFCGRVTLYYRGRILQTALLRTCVVATDLDLNAISSNAPLNFAVEAVLRRSLSTLDDRRRFDACIVLNKTVAGEPTAQVAGKDGAFITSLDEVAQELAQVNSLLNEISHRDKPHKKGLLSDENAKLLCELAAEGNEIYRSLVQDHIYRSQAADALRNSEYLQIVSTKPDAIVPLEFAYEYPRPRDQAPVCRNAIEALASGRCPATCKPQEKDVPAPHVCPLGFWGLSKVIERHLHDPDLPQVAKVTCEPISGRETISLNGPSLLATSQKVTSTDRKALKSCLASLGSGKVAAVDSWDGWKTAIKDLEPTIILALPHTDGIGANITLEISGDTLVSGYINENYVRTDSTKKHPIVLLLGCDTFNAALPTSYSRHIARFRQADAALVLGTVAEVLGKDAAKIAKILIERLVSRAKTSPAPFGEVLLQTKREAVADSLMIAMCLVAFGDADWKLE